MRMMKTVMKMMKTVTEIVVVISSMISLAEDIGKTVKEMMLSSGRETCPRPAVKAVKGMFLSPVDGMGESSSSRGATKSDPIPIDFSRSPDGCDALFATPPPAALRPWLLPPMGHFLSECFRRRKKFSEVNIFAYRGENGFCSEDCVRNEIGKEWCHSREDDMMKPPTCGVGNTEEKKASSVSPPSSPSSPLSHGDDDDDDDDDDAAATEGMFFLEM